MPVPLAVAASAAAASLAYLNAKSGFSQDYQLAKGFAIATVRTAMRKRKRGLNLIFEMEDRARDPKTASRPFLIFEGQTFTYEQAYDTSLRYGHWLRTRLGVKPGDMVAIDFQNSHTFIFLWFAIWSVGAIPVFINYNLTGKSLAHCLRASSAKICLVDPAVAAAFDDGVRQDLGEAVKVLVFTPDVEAEASVLAPIRSPDAHLSGRGPSDTALLIFTSGTTGLPKPAIVAWFKVWYGATLGETMAKRGAKDDVMYTSMPLYHTSAAILAVCSTVTSGGTQGLGRKFSTKGFWDDVRACKATSIQYVGETLRYLLAAPVQRDPITGEVLDKQHSVRTALGNGLRIDIWNKFKDRFGIDTVVEFYGATEAPGALWAVSKNDFTAGAIGRMGWLLNTLMWRHWRLVQFDLETQSPRRDPETGFCIPVTGSDEPGEMLYRLEPDGIQERFQGYLDNPQASSFKILRDVFTKGDAYFRTGDLLRWDADGRLFFADRIGDTFRWKSENVSTTEVSETIGRHPNVREANVYGVELPHHDGKAGCVAICFDTEAPDQETLQSFARHVHTTLPRYARPLFLRIVRDVAAHEHTTGTNKQQKHNLRDAGVKPAPDTDFYWLKDQTYVPFGEKEWRMLQGGRVKL